MRLNVKKLGRHSSGCILVVGFRPPTFFLITFFLCNHFEELQTVLFEVELIINNAALTYVNPNTTKTCLIPNHLLFGRQLSYSSNTASTVVRNLIRHEKCFPVLSSFKYSPNNSSHQFKCIKSEFYRACNLVVSDLH